MERIAGKGIAEGVECIHCLGSGYMLEEVETTFGEFEDVSYICICRKAGIPPGEPTDPSPAPASPELAVLPGGDSGMSEGRRKRLRGGIELYRERGAEVEWVRGDTYLVPSRSGERWEFGKRVRVTKHTVDLATGACECDDHSIRGAHCAHLVCAQIKQSKTLARLRREAEARPVKRFDLGGFSGTVDFDALATRVPGRMIG